MLSRLALPLAPASLLLACSHPPAPRAPQPIAALSTAGYRTISPDVSVSRNADAQNAEVTGAARASIDTGEDVMAEILAIPPGR